nr:DUF423 domain-containing protein [Paenochrobactrum gallinarii]
MSVERPDKLSFQVNRYFSTIGGLTGALALITYAGAAHNDTGNLNIVAPILLGHAPAFLALSILSGQSRTATIGGSAILIGLILFCGDLLSRDFLGDRLFPFAAPTGGTVLILGWLITSLTCWSKCK